MSKFEIQTPHFKKDKEGINLSALAVRERSVTLFFILAVITAGAVAYFNLGRAEDPKFTVKVFTVTAAWPGATAQEMQDLVAEPLEKRMQELTYYDHVDTFTRPGLAFPTVTLKDYTPPEILQKSSIRAARRFRMKLPSSLKEPCLRSSMTNTRTSSLPFTRWKLRDCLFGCLRGRQRLCVRISCTFPE
jgi:multidrug efflux pump subunit AcrB